jgi:hypothetical protein
MISPKEKAIELFDNMLYCYQGHIDEYTAKQCALIAVDELITAHNKMKDFLFNEIGYLITTPDYWTEVKKEIEKL